MEEWKEKFLTAIKDEPLIVYKTINPDYLTLQLATPLEDRDDAILLYIINEGKNGEGKEEFSISDQAWIATLLPYENYDLTEEIIVEEAKKMGFDPSGLNLFKTVDETNVLDAIKDFDALVKKLQNYH